MTKADNEQIIVVCYANFCRSPVAEYLLKKRFGDNYRFISAGLNPMKTSGMHTLSEKFLNYKKIENILHIPRTITTDQVKISKLVLAADQNILMELNKRFPRHKDRIRALNFRSPKHHVFDPIQMCEERYMKVMQNIQIIVDEIIFD